MNGAVAAHYVHALAVGTDEAAAVDLDFVILADDAELHGVPEKASEFFDCGGVIFCGADAAVVLKKAGKDLVRVHGHVAKDIVKDVGLGSVLERFSAAQPGGGREGAHRKHLK